MANRNSVPSRADFVDYVNTMLREGIPFKQVGESLNISDSRQLKRMMSKALGYKFRVYHQFTNPEMSNTIESALPIREHGANWGIRHVRAALARLQIRAPRRTVARALQTILEAHYNRRRRALPIVRRQYNVTIPMALWHIDSYDKLTMFGIRIHGCIDGASHYVLYARVASNKSQETLFEPFSEAVRKFGCPPLRVRSDFASEHALIRRYMLEVRSETRNPFLVGSSVHNQRIEHWWRLLWEKVIWFQKNAIEEMVQQGHFIPDDPYQRASFQSVYIPILQEIVNEWIGVWNLHRVRLINGQGRFRPSHVPARYFREYERLQGWTSHIEDMNAQDDERHIGTQDLGPHGLRTWVARRNAPDATLFDIPNLPAHLLALRDAAYSIGKVGKDVLECFHLHYFMTHYCYLSLDTGTAIGQLLPLQHSAQSLQAFHILVTTLDRLS